MASFPVLYMLCTATATAVSVLCLFAWYTSFPRFLAAGNSGLIHNTIVPVLGAIHAIPTLRCLLFPTVAIRENIKRFLEERADPILSLLPIHKTSINRFDTRLFECDAAHQEEEEEGAILVFVHGRGPSIHTTDRVHKCHHLQALGVTVVAIDPRGVGESKGIPSTESLASDVVLALRWANDRAQQRAQVILLGESLGGGIAAEGARLALQEGVHLDYLILLSTFETYARAIEEHFMIKTFLPFLWMRSMVARWNPIPLNVSDSIRALDDAGVKTRLYHGVEDGIISIEHLRHMKQQKRLWKNTLFIEIEKQGHDVMCHPTFQRHLYQMVHDRSKYVSEPPKTSF